jgi:hypothetical protein
MHSGAAQVDCRTLAILNFHLPSLGQQSAAALTVHAALSPFFLPTPIHDISADLGINDDDSDFEDYMSLDTTDAVPPTKGKKSSISLKSLKVSTTPILPETDPSLYFYRDVPFHLGTEQEMLAYEGILKQLVIDLRRYASIH